MDTVELNAGYDCGQCARFIPMNSFDGINKDGKAICYVCREDGKHQAANHLKRIAESMGFSTELIYIAPDYTSIEFGWKEPYKGKLNNGS